MVRINPVLSNSHSLRFGLEYITQIKLSYFKLKVLGN